MKRNILVISLVFVAVLSGCSKYDPSTSLKESVENSVARINTAISDLSDSKGFHLLTTVSDPAKGETDYSDSIDLEMIAGIYDFDPSQILYSWYPSPRRFFKKSGESENMVVNMPHIMAYNPRMMYNYIYKDTVRHNNFTITASDYHYYYSKFSKYDYKLLAGFSLDNEDIGTLDLIAHSGDLGWFNADYTSRFTFPDGYDIEVALDRDDTTTVSFSLADDDGILLKETRSYSGARCHPDSERTYKLTIGNVDIVRSNQIDSIQVYLNGVLQKKAAAKVFDNSDTTGTICHRRDILLTFDDGTTANLSEMIKPGMDVLKTLIDSLQSMYFAKHVVDYIALNIYYHEYKMPHND
jgi:hypothetical protein